MPEFIASRKNPYPDGTYPITDLFLFPQYQTREEYKKATGKDAPPYNPTQPVKNWFDPDAAGKRVVTYQFLSSDSIGNRSIGEPETLGGGYAASVNMLTENFTGLTPIEKQNSGTRMPVPVRDLYPGEEIVVDFGNIPKLRDKSLATQIAVSTGGGFTEADRNTLKDIVTLLRSFQNPAQK